MDKATAATLLMIVTAEDGKTGTHVYEQPSVESCEQLGARMLANPKHKGAGYSVRSECLPHYRDDTLFLRN
jgi:hypothetical protein